MTARWEDRGSKDGVHEWRMRLPVPFGGCKFVRVILLESDGAVQAETKHGYVRRFPGGTVDEAKAYLEQDA